MMSRADCNTLMVKEYAHIVGMGVAHEERDDPRFVRRLADKAHPVDSRQLLRGVCQQLLLVGSNVCQPDAPDVFDGLAQPDDIAHRRGARLEFVGQLVVGRLLEGDVLDHLTTPLIRLHLVEPLRFAVHHADTHRGVHLVAGETVEVAVEGLHIHRTVRHGLRSVDKDGHIMAVRDADDLLNRVDGAQRVGDVRHGYNLGALGYQGLQFPEHQLPFIVERQHFQRRAAVLAGQLPRHDVRVVLHFGNDDLVARVQVGAPEGGRHQIDGLGRAAREDDLLCRGRVDVLPHRLARLLELVGSQLAETVHAAMDVAVDAPVVVAQRVNHHLRLLRGGGIV